MKFTLSTNMESRLRNALCPMAMHVQLFIIFDLSVGKALSKKSKYMITDNCT